MILKNRCLWYISYMDKDKVKQTLIEQMPVIKDKYHVKNMGIFGSVARGEQNEKSDVDILVEFSSPIGMFDFIRLENFLSKILGKKVDLVSKNAIKSIIKNDILSETVYV